MNFFKRALIAEAKYRGFKDPHFVDGELAATDANPTGKRLDRKEARNIAYATIYSAPIIPDVAD